MIKKKRKKYNKILIVVCCIALAMVICLAYKKYGNDILDKYFEKSYTYSDKNILFDGFYINGYDYNGSTYISVDDMLNYGFEASFSSSNDGEIMNLRSTSEAILSENIGDKNVFVPSEFKAVSSDLKIRINGIDIDAMSFDNHACVNIDTLISLNDDYNIEWGYSDYNMRGTYDIESGTYEIENFRFKVDDWSVLLHEMEDKVDDVEIDIYTEGDLSEGVYYGAKFEPHGGIYAGIVSDGNGDPEIGKEEVFHHDFGVYSSYIEFDEFQTDLNKPSSYILPEKDCISQVPWNISDINLVLSDKNDKYIREVLDNLDKYQKPTIIRFGAEMNIGTLGDSPSGYIKAFRKIADIIHNDYPNFAVMWSPNDSGSLDRPFEYFYPGDEYVDWIGVSSFSKKDFLGSLLIEDNPDVETSKEAQIYFTLGDYGYTTNSLRYITDFMKKNNINKPLAISEGGVVSRLSYNAIGYDEKWGDDRIRNMYYYAAMRYPELKSIVYFNHDMETEVIGFDLSYKPEYIKVMEEAFSSGAYILKYGDSADFTYVLADKGREYKRDDLVPIYGYIYVPEKPNEYVTYILDGEVYDTQYKVPYKTNLDLSSLGDGVHSLTVSALCGGEVYERSYEIYVGDNKAIIN